MLDPPIKILQFLLLLRILSAASTFKQSSIEEFSFDNYDDESLNEIRSEKFSCEGRPYGYYADQEQDCKVFHICSPVLSNSGRHVKAFMYSFNCPETTIFSQDSRTCITEKYALPCRRAHTLYSLNKAIGQITPKDARKHVPGSFSFHTNNAISEVSGVTPKPAVSQVATQRLSSGNSTYKPTVRGGSQIVSNLANTNNINFAKKETVVDKSFDQKVSLTVAEKSEAIDGIKDKNAADTLQTDGKKNKNLNNDKTRTPNTDNQRDDSVHQSLLSSQKFSKDVLHDNKPTFHNPAKGKPNPSFNFRASLGNDTNEGGSHSFSRGSPIISDSELSHAKDSISTKSILSNDLFSSVQNISQTHNIKPQVMISSSKPIQLPKSKVTATNSNDDVKLNQNEKIKNLTMLRNLDKVEVLDENKLNDFSDYEIDNPELEELYEEIYEFKPKASDPNFDSGYVDSEEIYSDNDVSSQRKDKNVNISKSTALKGALSEKILPPPPISNSLLNHNVILTNMRARHNERTKITNQDSTSVITAQTENENEKKRVAGNIQRGNGRSQPKPSPPFTVTRDPKRTTATIQKITMTTRSPVPRNFSTTTLRPISSERGAKRFVPSSLLRQNSNIKESQLIQIEENIKINVKKQFTNTQNDIPSIRTTNASQNAFVAPIPTRTRNKVTTAKPLDVTPISSLHNDNVFTVTEEDITAISYDDTQTTTEINDFKKRTVTNVSHKHRELVDSSPLIKFPTIESNNEQSFLNKEQNGKVRKVTRTRISPKKNSELPSIVHTPVVQGPSNRATADIELLVNNEQKGNEVAINSNSFSKTYELQQSELETTVGPLDGNFADDQNRNKKIAIDTASFRQKDPKVNINNEDVSNSSPSDASYQRNQKDNRGPSHGESVQNKERQITSLEINTSRQIDEHEKTISNNYDSKVPSEADNSQVSIRRRTSSRSRGSASFTSGQGVNSGLDTNRQSKSIDSTVPKLNDLAGNLVRQIPSKTRVVPNSKTVIISNINPINSSTSGFEEMKKETGTPVRKRIVASPQPSKSNTRRRGNKGSKSGENLQVTQNINKPENNFAARPNLLPKISGKLNLDKLSEIEKQIQRFASVNGAQLISYVVKKNDKHPKNKNKIEPTPGSKNTTEAKIDAKTPTIKELSKQSSIPIVTSAVTPLGKSNMINSQTIVQGAAITSVKKKNIDINHDDELIENVPTTDVPLNSNNDDKRYLPQNKQSNVQNEEPQSRSLKKHPGVNSVKLQTSQTTNKLPKIIGSSISSPLNVDIGKIKSTSNQNKNDKSSLEVNKQTKVITRSRSTSQQSRSNTVNLEIPTVTTISDVTIYETTTEIPRVVLRQRSRGRSQSARKIEEDIATSKLPSDLNIHSPEGTAFLQNENNIKDNPELPEKTLTEEKNVVTKNLRASNLEKIRNRVSAIKKNKEILPEDADGKNEVISVNSTKPAENQAAGVRSPVNLLNSLKNIKSQRERFKGGPSSVSSDSKILANESLISVNIEPKIEVPIKGNSNVDDFQTTTVLTTLKTSLNSRRSQVRQQGRSRNLSNQETLKNNLEKIDVAETIEVTTSNGEKEIPVEVTERPVNSQNIRNSRTRVRISNAQKSTTETNATNSLSIKEQEVSNEQLVKENKNSISGNSLSSQPKRITRTRNVIRPTEQNSKTQTTQAEQNGKAHNNNNLKVAAPRITRKRIATQTQTEPPSEQITENPGNNEGFKPKVNSLNDIKNESNTINTELKSGNSIGSQKRVTTKNSVASDTSEIKKDNAKVSKTSVNVVAVNSNSAAIDKEIFLNRKHTTTHGSSEPGISTINSAVTRKRFLSAVIPDPQEDTSNNENIESILNLENTSAISTRKVSRKRITASNVELPLTPNQNVNSTSESNKKVIENASLGANSVVAEKTPVNSIRRVSRKRVTTHTNPNAYVSPNNITDNEQGKKDDISPSIKKVSPNILDAFTSTTEKPIVSSRKNHSSRGGAKFQEQLSKVVQANTGSKFAHELLTDVNENQKTSTGAQQYSIAVTGSEANTKNKVLKKVSPARQFHQKVSEGEVENAEVFSGLKLRVVGTSVKSSISSTSTAADKKSNLEPIASASRTNTRTLTDLELDALRSLTQVNEPLRQPGRSRNFNRRLISKRKV